MRRAAALALAAALAAGPVLAAGDPVLGYLMRRLDRADTDGLRAAIAACIDAAGDRDALHTSLAGAGWNVSSDDEMGIVAFTGPENLLAVTSYADGSICEVASEQIGTGEAFMALQVIMGSAGLGSDHLASESGCGAYRLSDAIVVEITSTGQDPVCESDTTMALRVLTEG